MFILTLHVITQDYDGFEFVEASKNLDELQKKVFDILGGDLNLEIAAFENPWKSSQVRWSYRFTDNNSARECYIIKVD